MTIQMIWGRNASFSFTFFKICNYILEDKSHLFATTGYIIGKIKFNYVEANMNKTAMEYFKDRLIKEKKKVLHSLNQKTSEEYGSIDMSYTELSGFDNHPGDIATEVFFMEQNKGFKNQLDNTLEEIEESFEDLKNGDYGICKLCHKKIHNERLEVIPYVKTCIECSTEEKLPIEYRQFESIDQDKFVSFSMYPRENIMYDREDTYQDVDIFNIVPNDPSYSTGDNIGIMDEEEHGIVEDIEQISQEYYEDTLK